MGTARHSCVGLNVLRPSTATYTTRIHIFFQLWIEENDKTFSFQLWQFLNELSGLHFCKPLKLYQHAFHTEKLSAHGNNLALNQLSDTVLEKLIFAQMMGGGCSSFCIELEVLLPYYTVPSLTPFLWQMIRIRTPQSLFQE